MRYAGMRKEHEATDEQKREGIQEFALGKGFVIAVFSGIMSAGFAFAMTAGEPIGTAAHAAGAPDILKNAPAFILIMGGGFSYMDMGSAKISGEFWRGEYENNSVLSISVYANWRL